MTDEELDKLLEELKNYVPTEEEIKQAALEDEQEEQWDGGPFPDLCEEMGVDRIYIAEGVWWDNVEKKTVDEGGRDE